MITVSTNIGDFTYTSTDDVIEFLQTTKHGESDIWISREKSYPCISICINGEYAAVHYFQNETGEMWLSYSDENKKEVSFIAGGDVWKPDSNAIIQLGDVFSCVREFLDTNKKPTCIQWQEL